MMSKLNIWFKHVSTKDGCGQEDILPKSDRLSYCKQTFRNSVVKSTSCPGVECNAVYALVWSWFQLKLRILVYSKYELKLDFQTLHNSEAVSLNFAAAARNRKKEQPKRTLTTTLQRLYYKHRDGHLIQQQK